MNYFILIAFLTTLPNFACADSIHQTSDQSTISLSTHEQRFLYLKRLEEAGEVRLNGTSDRFTYTYIPYGQHIHSDCQTEKPDTFLNEPEEDGCNESEHTQASLVLPSSDITQETNKVQQPIKDLIERIHTVDINSPAKAMEQYQILSDELSQMPSEMHTPYYHQAKSDLYEAIIAFIDAEYYRLYSHNKAPEKINALALQYDQIIIFFAHINFDLFERSLSEKLRCYEVTMLLGSANIYGMMRNNEKQLQLAKMAEALTQTLPYEISEAYLDGNPFYRGAVLHTCHRLQQRAQTYLSWRR